MSKQAAKEGKKPQPTKMQIDGNVIACAMMLGYKAAHPNASRRKVLKSLKDFVILESDKISKIIDKSRNQEDLHEKIFRLSYRLD